MSKASKTSDRNASVSLASDKDLLKALPVKTHKTLTERLNGPGLKHFAVHWSLILVFGLLIYLKIPGWQVIMVPQGISIVFLFTLLHETVHQTPFRTRWVNDTVAKICGFMIFLPVIWFKYFHLAHHRHTQVPGKDPELEVEKPKSMGTFIWHVSGIPTWVGHFKTIIKNTFGYCSADFIPKKVESRIVKESRWLVLIYTIAFSSAYWFGFSTLFWVWIFPLLLGQPFLRFYLLAEHGLCPYVANALENTRTTFTNRLICFLAWNMPYHTEHHINPMVPFHNLPDLHVIIRDQLVHTENGYIVFTNDYIKKIKKAV